MLRYDRDAIAPWWHPHLRATVIRTGEVNTFMRTEPGYLKAWIIPRAIHIMFPVHTVGIASSMEEM